MKTPLIATLLACGLILGACSQDDDSDSASKDQDHIWKNQTDALKQAQQLQGTLNEETRRKEKQLEEVDR